MSARVDVAVVGAGPAGLAAARAAAATGAWTVLIDEGAAPGGQLRWRRGPFAGASGPDLATALATEVPAVGVELRLGTAVWGIFGGNDLGLRDAGGSSALRAARIVLATGGTERALVFPGASLPGVFTASALLKLVYLYGVLPGRRVAIAGDDALGDEVSAAVTAAGGEVVLRTTGADGIAAGGADGVRWVELAGERRAADIVVMAAGRTADIALAQMAECRLGFDAAAGRFVPALSERLETSAPGIFLAGEAAGPLSVEAALAEGAYAGLAAASSLGLADDARLEQARAALEDAAPGRLAAFAALEATFDQVDRVAMGAGA